MRSTEVVNLGVQQAREWCRAHGVPLVNPGPPVPPRAGGVTSLRFTEQMKGHITPGAIGPPVPLAGQAGSAGRQRL